MMTRNQRLQRALGAFLLLVILASLAAAISGCTGTKSAYTAAEGQPDRVAYVMAEQYAAVLHEAAGLKEKPTTPPQAVEAMRTADLAARPAVDRLRPAADAWLAAKNAQTEAELQAAINQAALLIGEMLNAVKAARGGDL